MTAPFGWVNTSYGLQRDYVLEGAIVQQQIAAQLHAVNQANLAADRERSLEADLEDELLLIL